MLPCMEPKPRTVARHRLPPLEAGFLGAGHVAIEVMRDVDLTESDPFVLLMDDRVHFAAGQKIGGAHPHAGLETVTFVVEGGMHDREEGELTAGDLVWMTAGSGVIHSEEIEAKGGPARILQLWVTLPERARHAPPRLQVLHEKTLPVHRAAGVEARIYSGQSHGLTAPTLNHVPVTLIDVRLEAGASFTQALPEGYGGFLYPLSGEVRIGETALREGDIGWLDPSRAASHLELTGGEGGGRVVLYAGQRQNEPTVHHGPFVAGSEADIVRMFRDFRAGKFASAMALNR